MRLRVYLIALISPHVQPIALMSKEESPRETEGNSGWPDSGPVLPGRLPHPCPGGPFPHLADSPARPGIASLRQPTTLRPPWGLTDTRVRPQTLSGPGDERQPAPCPCKTPGRSLCGPAEATRETPQMVPTGCRPTPHTPLSLGWDTGLLGTKDTLSVWSEGQCPPPCRSSSNETGHVFSVTQGTQDRAPSPPPGQICTHCAH